MLLESTMGGDDMVLNRESWTSWWYAERPVVDRHWSGLCGQNGRVGFCHEGPASEDHM